MKTGQTLITIKLLINEFFLLSWLSLTKYSPAFMRYMFASTADYIIPVCVHEWTLLGKQSTSPSPASIVASATRICIFEPGGYVKGICEEISHDTVIQEWNRPSCNPLLAAVFCAGVCLFMRQLSILIGPEGVEIFQRATPSQASSERTLSRLATKVLWQQH